MEFLQELKKCEPNVTQIARDAGLARQAVYLWKGGAIPRKVVFDELKAMDKYKAVLANLSYAELRAKMPYGRRVSVK